MVFVLVSNTNIEIAKTAINSLALKALSSCLNS